MNFYLELMCLLGISLLVIFANFVFSIPLAIESAINDRIKKVTLAKTKYLFLLSLWIHRKGILPVQKRKQYFDITKVEFIWLLAIYIYCMILVNVELLTFLITGNGLYILNQTLSIILLFIPIVLPILFILFIPNMIKNKTK